MTEINANPFIGEDTDKVTELALSKMQEALVNVTPSKNLQIITLVLTADKSDLSKWVLDISNESALTELYSAFFFGETDMTVIEKTMKDVIAKEMSKINSL